MEDRFNVNLFWREITHLILEINLFEFFCRVNLNFSSAQPCVGV